MRKFFLYSDILTISPILNLGSLSLISLLELIYVFRFTSPGFIFIVLWSVLFYLFTITYNLWIYTFFDIKVIYLKILFFKILINLWATTDFPLLCIEYIYIAFFNHDFIDLLKTSMPLSFYQYFVWSSVWFI